MRLSKTTITVLLLLLSLAACSTTSKIIEPLGEDDPILEATASDVDLDVSYLERVADHFAERDDHELRAIVVARDGKLVFERYFDGYGPHNPHDIRSATKSITSLLTGIAIDRGALEGVDTPMMELLSDSYPDIRDKEDILVRHLLTMSSGLDCDDGDHSTRGQEDRMYKSRDWVDYFLSLSRVNPPGEVTRYCTGGVVVLGEAIAAATGDDFAVFADEMLFSRLGIRNYEWARFDEGRKVDTGGHLRLTPRGMAKIGMLVLDKGKWNGEQIVPADWIEHSIAPSTTIQGEPYGYLWWRSTFRFEDDAVDVISARGNGGQVIFIVPEYDLVAVFAAGYYNSDDVGVVYNVFRNAVLTTLPELHRHIP